MEDTQTSVIDLKDRREAELGSLDECNLVPSVTGAGRGCMQYPYWPRDR